MANKEWISESQARLLRRDGIIICSYTPQADSPEYYALHRRCMDGDAEIEEYVLTLEDNPYIPKSAKESLYNDLKDDPDELAVRYYGNHATESRLVYPSYKIETHGVDPFDIPSDWMRFMVVDPGARFQCALFFAIPPERDQVHLYHELYKQNAHAGDLAEHVADITGEWKFETFILDYQAGRQRPMGHSNTIADHYMEEFKNHGLSSRVSGCGFEYGSDNVPGREQSLKRWLRYRVDGRPLLRVHRGKTPKFDQQMKNRYYKKQDPTKREDRQLHDTVDCAEYAAAHFDMCVGITEHGLFYNSPEAVVSMKKSAYQAWMEFEKKEWKMMGPHGDSVNLGPSR
jgi:hypothetical protein